jgi:TonB family protein
LRTYLENRRIGAANVKGVGSRLTGTLLAYGIESALDVTFDRVLAVPGFGPAKASALAGWRQHLVNSFRFDPRPNATDAKEKERINRGFNAKGEQLRNRLGRGASDLRAASQRVVSRWKTLDQPLVRVHRDLSQAEADSNAVERSPPERLLAAGPIVWLMLLVAIGVWFAAARNLPALPQTSVQAPAVAPQPTIDRFGNPTAYHVSALGSVASRISPSAIADISEQLSAGTLITAIGKSKAPDGSIWIAYTAKDGRVAFVEEPSVRSGAAEVKGKEVCTAKAWPVSIFCNDPDLRDADNRLGTIYRHLRGSTLPAGRAALVTSERDWLVRRDACQQAANVRACVADAYSQRIAELERLSEASSSSEPNPMPDPSATPTGMPSPSIDLSKAPIAKLNPGALFSSGDYPASALRNGDSGRVTVRLHITRFGSVDECDVAISSGSVDLDEATCKVLSRKGKYSPATDSAGQPTEGTVMQSVNWTLPD